MALAEVRVSDTMQVQIAGKSVRLERPSRKWRRILKAPVGAAINRELWQMACLGVCWGKANRPAGEANPRAVMDYGEAVLDDLLRREATDDELDEAGAAAMLLVFGEPSQDTAEPDPSEVGETADFSAPSADGNAT